MPVVSILIPCYQAVETLTEALESLLCQTLQDFEIVCVDDGSQDGTGVLLDEWAKCDQRIRVFHRPHEGIVSTLNAGLAECRASYVARMDADDRAHPERLERQIIFLEDHPQVDVVSCRVAAFPPGRVREGFRVYLDWLNALLSDEQIQREIFVESPLPHPSVIFRRRVVQDAGGYKDNGWAEDYDLWLRLRQRGSHFGKLPETLLEWRESPQRLTRRDRRYSLENFLRLKAYYLKQGPLQGRDALIIWGAGMTGRRLGKQLARLGVPLMAFVDIAPGKMGRTCLGHPVMGLDSLLNSWAAWENPLLLSAVGSRAARPLIRNQLETWGLRECQDWWAAA